MLILDVFGTLALFVISVLGTLLVLSIPGMIGSFFRSRAEAERVRRYNELIAAEDRERMFTEVFPGCVGSENKTKKIRDAFYRDYPNGDISL